MTLYYLCYLLLRSGTLDGKEVQTPTPILKKNLIIAHIIEGRGGRGVWGGCIKDQVTQISRAFLGPKRTNKELYILVRTTCMENISSNILSIYK